MRLTFRDPGGLGARLELQEQVATPDGQGGATLAWQPVATLWGEVVPISLRHGEEADVKTAALTHRVLIRRRAGVLRGMRFSWRGRLLEIAAIRDPDETGRYLECHCQEAAP